MLFARISPKTKKWKLGDEDEKYRLWHYEAGELWIDLRQAKATDLFTGVRSNMLDEGGWVRLSPPQQNQAVAGRRALEMVLRAVAETIVLLRESQASSGQ